MMTHVAMLVAMLVGGQAQPESGWRHTGIVAGQRTAIRVGPDEPNEPEIMRIVLSGRAGLYTHTFSVFDCAAGTRIDRGSTTWSTEQDPVRQSFAPARIHFLATEPELAAQFEAVCRPRESDGPISLTLDDFLGRYPS